MATARVDIWLLPVEVITQATASLILVSQTISKLTRAIMSLSPKHHITTAIGSATIYGRKIISKCLVSINRVQVGADV